MVAYEITAVGAVGLLSVGFVEEAHVRAYAGVFVYDGAANHCAFAYAYARPAGCPVFAHVFD